MKFKLFALCLLTAMAISSFSTTVVAQEASATDGPDRRGYILLDPWTGATDERYCKVAPVGFCWYRYNW